MAAKGLCPVTLSFTTRTVHKGSEYRIIKESWPTHKPTIILNSVFTEFKILAWVMGLHIASKFPAVYEMKQRRRPRTVRQGKADLGSQSTLLRE